MAELRIAPPWLPAVGGDIQGHLHRREHAEAPRHGSLAPGLYVPVMDGWFLPLSSQISRSHSFAVGGRRVRDIGKTSARGKRSSIFPKRMEISGRELGGNEVFSILIHRTFTGSDS